MHHIDAQLRQILKTHFTYHDNLFQSTPREDQDTQAISKYDSLEALGILQDYQASR